ncbi:MAG: hypothetical protein JSV01_03120, partial [Desulfobacterales bacterium]
FTIDINIHAFQGRCNKKRQSVSLRYNEILVLSVDSPRLNSIRFNGASAGIHRDYYCDGASDMTFEPQ